VDDLAGQEHALGRKFLSRLIRVVNGAIDAVAEPEFLREVEREPSGRLDEARRPEVVDDTAVVGGGQVGRDRLFQVEALTEDDRGQT
jgi:hypothetical protein